MDFPVCATRFVLTITKDRLQLYIRPHHRLLLNFNLGTSTPNRVGELLSIRSTRACRYMSTAQRAPWRCARYLVSLGVRKRATSDPVSYTHLRAHETGRNLVCRL